MQPNHTQPVTLDLRAVIRSAVMQNLRMDNLAKIDYWHEQARRLADPSVQSYDALTELIRLPARRAEHSCSTNFRGQ